MRDTRAASEEELFAAALPRLDALLADGVTTVEIKSGYGLDVENELKMLRVARRLGEARPVRVVTSLLGAHALPPEYRDDSDGYIDLVCQAMIPLPPPRAWPTPSTSSARRSPSRWPSANASSRRPRPTACRSRPMPSSSPILGLCHGRPPRRLVG
nr:hypothetical protein [Halomonas elongata]